MIYRTLTIFPQKVEVISFCTDLTGRCQKKAVGLCCGVDTGEGIVITTVRDAIGVKHT